MMMIHLFMKIELFPVRIRILFYIFWAFFSFIDQIDSDNLQENLQTNAPIQGKYFKEKKNITCKIHYATYDDVFISLEIIPLGQANQGKISILIYVFWVFFISFIVPTVLYNPEDNFRPFLPVQGRYFKEKKTITYRLWHVVVDGEGDDYEHVHFGNTIRGGNSNFTFYILNIVFLDSSGWLRLFSYGVAGDDNNADKYCYYWWKL